MRRLALLAVTTFACAQPIAKGWMTPEGVVSAEEPHAVYFYRIYRGSVKDCAECILMEHPDESGEQGRVAYFVRPESSCSLRKGDAEGVTFSPFEDRHVVSFQLRETGLRALFRCAKEPSESEYLAPQFLVVVNGQAVGLVFLDVDMIRFGTQSFFGTEDVGLIAEALRVETAPTLEL